LAFAVRLSSAIVSFLAYDARTVFLHHGLNADRTGLIISSSRAILYASSGADFAEAAARGARDTRDLINRYR
jgi:hypothetical protein